ncbi:P2X purinoceptor 4-like [Sinocyclocheilus rhinocerous]|uniref:P2X purinoceptor 4-like n=1 Tax=Sinocyclocheilus rhinocerous TaxID=307959 RepID=UPI0007B94815|nr:PREDICTED: P2X purinoceptor 4-like [Sinocyclocheilus rhinocerous]
MPCTLLNLCEYDTQKLVKIKSVRLGCLKWTLNGVILMFICIMMLWNKEYQEYDLVVSSVTTKVKGVAKITKLDIGEVVWDVVDYSGPYQGRNSFFVSTNVIVTKNQKQGNCPEVLTHGKLCRTDKDCEKGFSDQHSHGVQTGACVKLDVLRKTCEVTAWCPIENKKNPRPALLASAENFTVMIKNNIRFPAFNYIRRNILPGMKDTDLKGCIYNRYKNPYCPIFRLGDIVSEAKENFSEMAVEGGVIGIQINWDCDLNHIFHSCLPKYSFRRLDEKESNRTLYPGLNFRFARYSTVNGVEQRTLFKMYGIRFDVMVFGKAGKFSIIQLIIYIGSTLSYYALTTVFLDWLIGTGCYFKEAKQSYTERKFEAIQDREECFLCVSFVDEDKLRVVKKSRKKRLQETKPLSLHQPKNDLASMKTLMSVLQCGQSRSEPVQNGQSGVLKEDEKLPRTHSSRQSTNTPLLEMPQSGCLAWCQCDCCRPTDNLQEQLCCRSRKGHCITSSPLFSTLIVSRSVLETALFYVDPLAELGEEAQLRHGAYAQFIRWRFGDSTPRDAVPVIPSCCVWRIRAEYPSPDGKYSGLRLYQAVPSQTDFNR